MPPLCYLSFLLAFGGATVVIPAPVPTSRLSTLFVSITVSVRARAGTVAGHG